MIYLSEEFKKDENTVTEQPSKKPFSVTIPEDDFVNDIPAPESDVPAGERPHKVVRYVESEPKKEKPKKTEKKKNGIVGEFFAGAAAGAKTVGEGISAGIKTVSEKKPKAEKPVKEPKPIKEKPAKPVEVDETQFPKDDKKSSGSPLDGIMKKLNALPTKAVIGGAAVLLVVIIAIILLAATSCSSGSETPEGPSSPQQGGITIDPLNPGTSETVPEGDTVVEVPSRKEQFAEAFNINNDVVGWLYIPGLSDVDSGVCFSYDSSYPYDKRDVTGKRVPSSFWINGAYYTHYRGIFGNSASELSANTVIFGHSDLGVTNLNYTNDDPTGPLFSQLFNFKDPSFAEKTPYIYLTLPGEDSVWEVFSVFYNDAKELNSTFYPYYKKYNNGGDIWYIEPNPTEDEYQLMLDTIVDRSLYDYGIEVTTDDQILTLSTCTVGYGYAQKNNHRFVIVAKLVADPATEHMNKTASFTINEDAPIPSSYKEEFEGYIKSWKPSK